MCIRDRIYGLLEVSDKPNKEGSLNGGNGVTNDIKLMVKVGRVLCIECPKLIIFRPIA